MSGNYGVYHKYFVLKPKGNSLHSRASRAAMRAFAAEVAADQPQMAHDLRDWAHREERAVLQEVHGEAVK